MATPSKGADAMIVDPPVRDDKKCAVCGKSRNVTKKKRRYAGAAIDLDPFCSTKCCRAYHGAPSLGKLIWNQDSELRRAA